MAETVERRARVERLLEAAQLLQNPATREGQALRRRLLETCGLSAAGIELGLARCLETHAAPEHLEDLLAWTPEATRAHVLLSGNVFVAALRAIAIGIAASRRVQVRASRRDPALAEALHALAPDLFELTSTLMPAPGEHFWAYGSDATLAELRASLPQGVWFHAHGSGIGAVVVDAAASTDIGAAARAVALDTALFDQRGCLSPRVVCVLGSQLQARAFGQVLASQLSSLDRELPPGPHSAEDAAERRKNRDAAAYAFELFDAGTGWVSLAPQVVAPPADRTLHVSWTSDAAVALSPFALHLTCIATNTLDLREALRLAFPGARLVDLGDMQRPALDGPVDHRPSSLGRLIT